jgi:hypothetical protein
MTRKERRYQTAIHEAGHAVMFRHLGYPVLCVTMSLRGSSAWTTPHVQKALEMTGPEDRLITIASVAAERIAYPGRNPLEHFATGRDFDQARSTLRQEGTPIDAVHAEVLCIADEAEEILREKWSEVEREAAYILSPLRLRYRAGSLYYTLRYKTSLSKVVWHAEAVTLAAIFLRVFGVL